jgi:hypothetical protein
MHDHRTLVGNKIKLLKMIDFTISEKRPHSSKRNRSILLIALVVGVLLIFFLLAGRDVVFIVLILALLFFVQMYKSGRADRYFIKHLKIKNENVEIIYSDRGDEKTFTGNLNDMIIRKENVILSKSRTIYLAIRSRKQLLIEQFLQDEWTEEKFDEIEQYVRKFKIIGKEIG